MKYNLIVRSVAQEAVSIPQKHEAFVQGTQGLPAPWVASQAVEAPDPGAQLSAMVRASKLFGKGLTGSVVYQFRRPFRDEAMHDDWVDLSFNPKKVDYPGLIERVLPQFVQAFDAYYADISDDEFIYRDFDDKRALKIEERHAVYRLSPASYIRAGLCFRAFGLSPAEVVSRLQGKVESVREALGGVLIVLTSEVLPIDEMDAISWQARAHLPGSSRA